MSGETNLEILIATMRPALHESPYVFCAIGQADLEKLSFDPLCRFREREGVTVIATLEQATLGGLPFEGTWAWITLTVHSSLSAVGFLAAVNVSLAQAGISVNPVSAFYHDHLFVPWEKRRAAMEILEGMSRFKTGRGLSSGDSSSG
jgi:uncharacterized protein